MSRPPTEMLDCPPRGLFFDSVVVDEARQAREDDEAEWAVWCADIDRWRSLVNPAPLRSGPEGTPADFCWNCGRYRLDCACG